MAVRCPHCLLRRKTPNGKTVDVDRAGRPIEDMVLRVENAGNLCHQRPMYIAPMVPKLADAQAIATFDSH